MVTVGEEEHQLYGGREIKDFQLELPALEAFSTPVGFGAGGGGVGEGRMKGG